MGLGGYLAARGDADHYASELHREQREIVERTEDERREVIEILESYGITREHSKPIVDAFERNPKKWVDWMMRFELGLEEPDPRRAVQSAVTIAVSYIVGGMIPLAPYIQRSPKRKWPCNIRWWPPSSRSRSSATGKVISPAPRSCGARFAPPSSEAWLPPSRMELPN